MNCLVRLSVVRWCPGFSASPLLREVPAHDAEAVPQRGVEGVGVETPVGAARDGDEPGRPRVLFSDHAEQPLELGGIGDQFRPGGRVAAAQPDPGRRPSARLSVHRPPPGVSSTSPSRT